MRLRVNFISVFVSAATALCSRSYKFFLPYKYGSHAYFWGSLVVSFYIVGRSSAHVAAVFYALQSAILALDACSRYYKTKPYQRMSVYNYGYGVLR
jgi:hypothetical protein